MRGRLICEKIGLIVLQWLIFSCNNFILPIKPTSRPEGE